MKRSLKDTAVNEAYKLGYVDGYDKGYNEAAGLQIAESVSMFKGPVRTDPPILGVMTSSDYAEWVKRFRKQATIILVAVIILGFIAGWAGL